MTTEPRRWTGTDLRAAREALGLTQAALADWLGWKQSRVSDAESGRRKVPDEVAEKVTRLEAVRDRLRTEYSAQALGGSDLRIDAAGGSGVPLAVHLMAATLATAYAQQMTGNRVHIVVEH